MKKRIALLLTLTVWLTVGVLVVLSLQGCDNIFSEEDVKADDSLPPEEEKKGMHKEEEGPKISEDYPYLNEDEFVALTEDQQEALVQLDPNNSAFRYYRKEQMILGNITEEEPRLDLETAKQIIADFESGKYSEKRVGDVFYKLFPYYDIAGGSGISCMQYWLDDARSAIITIWDSEAVTYAEFDEERNRVIDEELYPTQKNN